MLETLHTPASDEMSVVVQIRHQQQAHQELVNGRKRRAEEATSIFEWFWESGEVPEGSEPISDLIKDQLWTNPMRGGTEDMQVCSCQCLMETAAVLYPSY